MKIKLKRNLDYRFYNYQTIQMITSINIEMLSTKEIDNLFRKEEVIIKVDLLDWLIIKVSRLFKRR